MSKKAIRFINISNTSIIYSFHTINISGVYGVNSLYLKRKFFLFIPNFSNLLIRPLDFNYNSLWGTYFSCISNMCIGVTIMFKDTLIVDGVGYSFNINLDTLLVDIGFSNKVSFTIPNGLYCSISSDHTKLFLKSTNNIILGDFCYTLKNLRKYNPYKKIGIRSLDEFKPIKIRSKK
ncbi:hypothetical protein [Candidatus Vidania fulgoroideorum]